MFKKIWIFIRPTLLGDDLQPSGKRILGTQLIETGKLLSCLGLGAYFIKPELSLEGMAIFISPLFITGTAFWGITTMATIAQNKLNEEVKKEETT